MNMTTRPPFFYMPASALMAAGLLVCFMSTCQVMAAEPNEEKSGLATTASQPAMASYTVSQSTPIDKLIQTLYANSPLNVGVLRQALTEANPKVITGNPQQRVKAGTVMMVPEHAHIVRNVLTPMAATAPANPDNPESGPSARDNPVRKPWVRFP